MNSPFYESEQNALYPHRKHCNGVNDVLKHMKHLISANITTDEKLRSTAYGQLMNEYFINASSGEIYDAFRIYRERNALSPTLQKKYDSLWKGIQK